MRKTPILYFNCRQILAACLSWFSFFSLYAEAQERTGKPFITNYSVKEYNAYHQNWAVAQDCTGYIYVANNNGVLVYDGTEWNIIPTDKQGTVRSLAVGSGDRVYAGAQNEFGFIEHRPDGRFTFVPLDNKISDPSVKFEDVWKIHTEKEYVYFRTKMYIFCWNGDSISVLKADHIFSQSFDVKGKIYIYETNKGLSVLADRRLEYIEGTEFTKGKSIYVILPFTNDSILIGTKDQGFFIYGNKGHRPFRTEADEYIKSKILYKSLSLPGNRILFGTLYGGIIVIDLNGKFVKQIDLHSGLMSEKIHDMMIDRENTLWLAMDNGIAHVHYPSAFTYWDEKTGIEGVVQNIIINHDRVIAVTNAGLFELEKSHYPSRMPDFQFRKDKLLNTQVFDLEVLGNQYLCGTKEGAFLISPKGKKQLLTKTVFLFQRAFFDTSVLFAGKKDGVHILQYHNGKLSDIGAVNGISTEVRSICEDRDSTFWIGTRYEGVWFLKWNHAHPTHPSLVHYDTSNGLPTGYIQIYKVDNRMLFSGMASLHRFDQNRNRFYPDTVYNPAVQKAIPELKTFGISPIYREHPNRIWAIIDNRIAGFFQMTDSRLYFEHKRFGKIPKQTTINAMIHDPAGTAWLGGSDGIIRYDHLSGNTDMSFYRTIIRSVKTTANDSLLPFLFHIPGHDEPLEIPYSLNHIRIEYSALSYINERNHQFSVFLDGYDRGWSAWSQERYKEYMNLPEGVYQFKVRSKNEVSVLGEEAVFVFRVLPPWYRTWWAYMMYIVSGSLILFLLLRWRVYIYKKRNLELEEKVRERTTELTAAQNQLIQTEKFSALGQLVGGIAHEINNPLSVVDGNLFYFSDYTRNAFGLISELEERLKKDNHPESPYVLKLITELKERKDIAYMISDFERIIESTRHSSGRIKKIIDDLRHLSGTNESERIYGDIHECIEQALMSLQHVSRTEITVEKRCGKIPHVYCFPGLLTQALRHIILNAYQAIPGKGMIIIETSSITGEPDEGNSPRPMVKIDITDTGCGIPEHLHKNIFDPFFTTKAVGQGTGLGLSIAYHFIRRHDGQIRFHSKVQEGTTFEIMIPA